MNKSGPPSATSVASELSSQATVHEVGELKDKGIQKVRVLSASSLGAAVRLSVQRVLSQHLDGILLTSEDRRTLTERAEREMQALLAGPSGAAPLTETAPGIRSTSADFATLERNLVAELGNLIEKDWRADLRQMEDSNQRQISLLEQRISKLVRALESTDQVLAQIQQRQQHSNELTPTGDKTASSRSGLDPNGPLYRKKSQLLQALFQANLKLRELDQGDHR